MNKPLLPQKMTIRLRLAAIVIAVFAGLTLPGCRNAVPATTIERMIAINDVGSPRLYPIAGDKGAAEITADSYTYEQQLDRMIKAIENSGRKKILIYAFGGMNSVDDNTEDASVLSSAIYSQSDYYPILINWESSLFECYLDHLFMVRRGVRSYTFGPALSPFYLTCDLGRAVTRLPVNLVYQSYGTFASNDYETKLNEQTMEKLREMKMRAYLGKDNNPAYYDTIIRSIYIAGLPLRIVTTPLIDTCAKSSWDIMKRRSRTAFIKAQPFEIGYEQEINIALSPPDGAAALLMERLSKLYKKCPDYEFTLIGHSMGPFIINEIISLYPDLPYKNIVYLASACSVLETVQTLKPYLKNNPGSTFYNLCIHPHRDDQDMMIYGCLPRGSVLQWIDLYLSDPVNSDDLTVGQWDNAVLHLPRMMREVQSQIVVKAFGLKDPVTNTIFLDMPEQHTDFSNPAMRFWEPEFWQIPRKINQNKTEPAGGKKTPQNAPNSARSGYSSSSSL